MRGTSEERYRHSLLQDSSSFRLVTLLPGTFGDPLKCQIAEYRDCSETLYEALSYVWGDAATPRSIQVCETLNTAQSSGHIPITQNLFDILLHLRLNTSRQFWIDALCINQEDLKEKTNQVMHIGRLYQEARQVIIWLGDDQKYPRTMALLQQDGRDRWPLTLPERDIGELVTCPWFSRAWAVPEFLLARHAFFQLGPLLTSAKDFGATVKRTGTYIENDKTLYDQWRSIQLLFEYRNLVQEREVNDPTPRLTLVRLFLDLTRPRLCTDSRDRIYGILGAAADMQIVPDYTVPPRQVYKDFISRSLKAGDFSILHECCIGNAEPDEQSYVPFFGQSRSRSTHIPFADPSSAVYSAGLHLRPVVDMGQEKYISVQGFSIDAVQQKMDFAEDCEIDLNLVTSTVKRPTSITDAAQLPLHGTWGMIYHTVLKHSVLDPEEQSRWQKDLEVNRYSPQFSKAPYPHNSLFDVLTRAIRTDLNADYDWTSSKGRIRADAHLRRSRREILEERALFWTSAGFIGLSTCHVLPGDEVVVFGGDTTPFVLRKDVREVGTSSDVYKIVGDCYLCGWMYGPYPDKTVARNPSRRTTVTQKLKGLVGSSAEQESTPEVPLRTFIIG